tara:strand:+ start:366 stop:620 length:255 start_codon:yes stop_codon:yes gene_type:complete
MRLSEINKPKENYRDELYQTNNSYTIGVNDGKEFRNAIFTGTKLYHGKPMLTFVMKTDNEHINLNINQSYLSYSIEEPMEDENG